MLYIPASPENMGSRRVEELRPARDACKELGREFNIQFNMKTHPWHSHSLQRTLSAADAASLLISVRGDMYEREGGLLA